MARKRRSIPDQLRDGRDRYKPCEICRRPSDPSRFGTLCRTCRQRKRTHGHPKVSRMLHRESWKHLLPAVRDAIRAHRPSKEVLASMARLFDPPAMPKTRDMRSSNLAYLLWRELDWFASPESRYTRSTVRGYYKPLGMLKVLCAATAYLEEREGRGWPGDAEDTARVGALLSLFKRPGGLRLAHRIKRERKVPATVKAALVKRLRESTVLGVYVLQISRAVVATTTAKPPEQQSYRVISEDRDSTRTMVDDTGRVVRWKPKPKPAPELIPEITVEMLFPTC